MFDIGLTEIFVIGVVALVVMGPERLPRVAKTARAARTGDGKSRPRTTSAPDSAARAEPPFNTANQRSTMIEPDSFMSHLVELRDRLLRCVIVLVVVFGLLFYWARDLYAILAQPL